MRERNRPSQHITRRSALVVASGGLAALAGLAPAVAQEGSPERPDGWTEATHGKGTAPRHDLAFPADRVVEMTLTIAPGDWAAMLADLDEIYAAFRPVRARVRSEGEGLSQDARVERARQVMVEIMEAAAEGERPVFRRLERNPLWVPATVEVDGRAWRHVGLRFKGNTSLTTGYMAGDIALPFKLDFDQFEDDFPAIRNQRFFGFKQLHLSSNLHDPAELRDSLAYDILRDAGLPSLRTAPCHVVLNHGEGPLPLGLYTLIEAVDDTGVPSHFGNDDGNLYEAVGKGASFALDTRDLLETSFEKKTNARAADWSDLHRLHEVLHDPRRQTDAAGWRKALEAVFDVDGFLEWLGIASFIGHRDTYGTLEAVNSYLYDDPATGRLTWISWDHNDTFRPDFGRGKGGIDFTRDKTTEAFPLIRFLLDDPVYRMRHAALLTGNAATVLDPERIAGRIRQFAGVIRPVALRDVPPADYDAAVETVITYVRDAAADLEQFLTSRP